MSQFWLPFSYLLPVRAIFFQIHVSVMLNHLTISPQSVCCTSKYLWKYSCCMCSSFYLSPNSISPSILSFNFNVLSSSSSLPSTLIKIYSWKQSVYQYYLRKRNWFPQHIHLSLLLLLHWNILMLINRSYITTKMGKVILKKNCDVTTKHFLFMSWF